MAKVNEDQTEGVTAEEVVKPISGGKLKEVLKVRRQAREQRQEINKSVSEQISELVGDKNLDRVMLPTVEKLFNMKDERLALHLDNLLFMLDASGVTARADKVAKLPLSDTRKAPGGGSNVHALKRAAAPAE